MSEYQVSEETWRIVGPDDEPYGDIRIIDGHNLLVCKISQDDCCQEFRDMAWRQARAIKALPRLLAALNRILDSDIVMREEDEGMVSPELDMARDAVAEAEGVTL